MDISILLDNLPYLLVGTFPNGPLGGVALTLVLALTSAFASGVLGLAAGIALAVTHGAVHMALLAVLGFFRAIPVLMLMFWTYFLLPVVLHIDAPGQLTVVCALSLIGGAYLSHAVHAGIRAVGAAQLQAGLSLGFTQMQTLRFVVLPQALRIMAPSFINQWVSLIKDTSLAYIVGVPELSLLATQVNNRLMVYPAQIFALVAFIYVLICTAFDAIASRLVAVATPRPLR
ncbi:MULTISPECIES: amino acid ABC transporter permease [Burkholderiaceae]|uniref:amino acid ABC transporter permease n=1 Tax=Burkholderiaceae TaxID=119060 RepID=UPI00096182EF|nr:MULTISPECIES: amino acid ABC transporter permease [Burkholderiaceae]MCF2134836.1 amino acid ABC transporter permease [Mycetohabitans sp. B3]MCG1019350.1 amino acid ABC transporter permease [Mycetohabitans sp. B4]MCG1040156.1 amino acid ABC transporter permease [Mycetohabitans sp. B7]SIT65192.1 amino acid ABC transporter membrane protein 2, PAAT family (TC 3.A.1.3.-) [Burkholderia sp. b14]SIT78721.1 amino acid ABC transporter membrane protein 2, PAAT family (TC 3.A.1.3.-) [Burkholderia sp. b